MSRKTTPTGALSLLFLGLGLPLLLAGFRERRQRCRGHVGHDARLGSVVVSVLAQERVRFDRVPTPVNEAEARAHHYQHLVIVPEAPELAHGPGCVREDRKRERKGIVGFNSITQISIFITNV